MFSCLYRLNEEEKCVLPMFMMGAPTVWEEVTVSSHLTTVGWYSLLSASVDPVVRLHGRHFFCMLSPQHPLPQMICMFLPLTSYNSSSD